jgi:hypothetical protein
MTEPVLEYKRGEGWVYDYSERSPTFFDTDGRSVYLIRRNPEVGEPYAYYRKDSAYNPDGSIAWDEVIMRWSYDRFFPRCDDMSPRLLYFTVVYV